MGMNERTLVIGYSALSNFIASFFGIAQIASQAVLTFPIKYKMKFAKGPHQY